MVDSREAAYAEAIKRLTISNFVDRLNHAKEHLDEELTRLLTQSPGFLTGSGELRSAESMARQLCDHYDCVQREIRFEYAVNIGRLRQRFEILLSELIRDHKIKVDEIRRDYEEKKYAQLSELERRYEEETKSSVLLQDLALKELQDSANVKVDEASSKLATMKNELSVLSLRNQRLESELLPLEKTNSVLRAPAESLHAEVARMKLEISHFETNIRPELERVKPLAKCLKKRIEQKAYIQECLVQKLALLKTQRPVKPSLTLIQLETELKRMKFENLSDADTESSVT